VIRRRERYVQTEPAKVPPSVFRRLMLATPNPDTDAFDDREAHTKVALLSWEYPPAVYGGAGIHVDYLARELAKLTELEVHCFGPDRPSEGDRTVVAHRPNQPLMGQAPQLGALRAMSVDVDMAAKLGDADIVHSHTWYTNLAGHLAKLLYDIPHVVTSHSLEPLRPWKAGQLGSGYRVSSFCERVALESADAVIAVSRAAASEPADPKGFAKGLAEAIDRVIGDPRGAREMGRAGRRRVLDRFSWSAAATQTVAIYQSLLPSAI
jgi:glycosyltransferase involved in cell wall biosynthesis